MNKQELKNSDNLEQKESAQTIASEPEAAGQKPFDIKNFIIGKIDINKVFNYGRKILSAVAASAATAVISGNFYVFIMGLILFFSYLCGVKAGTYAVKFAEENLDRKNIIIHAAAVITGAALPIIIMLVLQ